MLDKRYLKTPAGQAEIQAKAIALTRPVRNLLLLINDSQPGSHWVTQIHGLSADDLAHLLAEGLIRDASPARAEVAAPVAAPRPRPAGAVSSSSDGMLDQVQQAVRAADYTALYDTLTAQGRAQLGLVKGLRFVLEVEKCSGLTELQRLALNLIDQLLDEHGMSAVRRFSEALSSQTPGR